MSTFGPTFVEAHDGQRLNEQRERIKKLMLDGQWRTLAEIESTTGDPQASISAQLRHLRKERYGAFIVELRARGDRKNGLYEYRLLLPKEFTLISKACPRCGGHGHIKERIYKEESAT